MGLFEFFQRLASPRNIRILFLITLILSITFPLYFISLIGQYSGGLPILDMSWGYTYTDVGNLFAALGAEGRNTYLTMYVVDLVFPLTLALSLAFALTFLISNLFPENKLMRFLTIFPFIAAAFDYMENVIIISQLLSYPGISVHLILISSWLTSFKFLFLIVSASILLILLIVHIADKRQK